MGVGRHEVVEHMWEDRYGRVKAAGQKNIIDAAEVWGLAVEWDFIKAPQLFPVVTGSALHLDP